MHVLGSVLWTLVFKAGLRGTVSQRLSFIWGRLVRAYRELGVSNMHRMPEARVMQVFGGQQTAQLSQYPVISGKAAQNRHMVPALLLLFEQLCTDTPGLQDRVGNFWRSSTWIGFISSFRILCTTLVPTSLPRSLWWAASAWCTTVSCLAGPWKEGNWCGA